MENKKTKTKERKIIKVKNYYIKCTDYADGTNSMERKSDGFDPFELLGILEFTQIEIIDQIKGKIKPDFVKRIVAK